MLDLNTKEIVYDDLGVILVEEDCLECRGSGELTINGGLKFVTAGLEALADAGICTGCLGRGRTVYGMPYGEIGEAREFEDGVRVIREKLDEWMESHPPKIMGG